MSACIFVHSFSVFICGVASVLLDLQQTAIPEPRTAGQVTLKPAFFCKMRNARIVKIVVLCLCIIALVGIYYFIDPMKFSWMPKCPFHMLTGYKCPGCGTQRALYAFVHGKFIDGILANPILLPSLSYVGLLLGTRKKSVHDILAGKMAGNIILFVICVYWLLRNIFNF